MQAKNVSLKGNEGKFMALATLAMIEQLEKTSKNQNINWNPETRKIFKDMLEAGKGLRIKLANLGFDMTELPPFLDGDEDEFLTKES